MREFKFRVWDEALKRFVPSEFLFMNMDGKVTHVFDGGRDVEDFRDNKDAIITQYTGLKDKNGEGCYEGDIIQYRNFGTQGHHWQWTRDENGKEKLGGEIKYEGYLTKGIVKYSEGSFRIDVCHLHEIFSRDGKLFEYREKVHGMTSKTETTYGEFEVIGNIYENPELLEDTHE